MWPEYFEGGSFTAIFAIIDTECGHEMVYDYGVKLDWKVYRIDT